MITLFDIKTQDNNDTDCKIGWMNDGSNQFDLHKDSFL